MIQQLIKIFMHSIMISGFVFIMMLVIEYINVQTKGLWQKNISKNKWSQYLIAAILGSIPGCLGAFTIVAMFSHKLVSFGALVTTMIATSGDEAFVMFSMFPSKALLITLILLLVGITAGYLTDKFYRPKKLLDKFAMHEFPLHEQAECHCFDRGKIWIHLFHPSAYRLSVAIIIITLILGISFGILAGKLDLWLRISVLSAFFFSLFIVLTVPNHFMEKHIWGHIVKKHLPKIFLWIFGTLLIMHLLMHYIHIEEWISQNLLLVLLLSIVLGIIPESGPHLVFVTLFAQGSIPISILMASSISQDGHAGLPLLAESKRSFLMVKIINMGYALIIGLSGYLFHF